MTAREDRPVWYVAYGSNLSAARLRCYLQGGTPTGARRAQPGARDPRPPSGDRRHDLPHALGFGGRSRKWGGGVAFLDVRRRGRTLGRAWRLTVGQLADLVAQENDLAPGAVVLTDDRLAHGGPVHPGRYGRLHRLRPIRDEPAVTLTVHVPPRPAAPSMAYLAMIDAGRGELGERPLRTRANAGRGPRTRAGAGR